MPENDPSAEPDVAGPSTWRGRSAWFWREWAKPILVVVLIVSLFRSAIADWNDVPSGSMKPTILEGDRIFVNKLAYGLRIPFTSVRVVQWSAPRRGDVVVFLPPGIDELYVKRVVGIPGDQVELRENRLLINGQPVEYGPLAEAFALEIDAKRRHWYHFASERLGDREHPVMTMPGRPSLPTFGPTTVPPGSYFMMGDNRDSSYDSRWFGLVESKRIFGRAFAVAISLDPENLYFPRWHRFFDSLP